MDTESRMWLPGRRGLGKGKMGKGTAENGDRGESVEESSEKQKLLHVLGNVLSILGSASKMQTSSSQII